MRMPEFRLLSKEASRSCVCNFVSGTFTIYEIQIPFKFVELVKILESYLKNLNAKSAFSDNTLEQMEDT